MRRGYTKSERKIDNKVRENGGVMNWVRKSMVSEDVFLGMSKLGMRRIWRSIDCRVKEVLHQEQLAETYRERKNDLYVSFVDLEKVYDRVCIDELQEVLETFDVEKCLVHYVQNFSE